MYNNFNKTFFEDWKEEINASLLDNQSLYIALFSIDGALLLANKAMQDILITKSADDLLNPSFAKLLHLSCSNKLIYDGYATFGKESQDDNLSLDSRIYRKADTFLFIGAMDVNLLIAQNRSMTLLNNQILDLQRSLIKEKYELEKVTAQLRQANDRLNEANITKDNFFSIIAHDLKNPFSVLLGLSDALSQNLEEYDTSSVKEMITMIRQTSYQTYQLLEDLLLWSRSQLGKLNFNPEKIFLYETCQAVLGLLEPLALKKEIHISCDIPLDICIVADVGMLQTILRNLFSNALKFTPHGGEIKLSVIPSDYNIEIVVSDTGIGMNENVKSNLWNLTTSVSRSGTDGEDGTGLGLHLCKELVEKQGGKIWVYSCEGKGSQFTFTLPKCSDWD